MWTTINPTSIRFSPASRANDRASSFQTCPPNTSRLANEIPAHVFHPSVTIEIRFSWRIFRPDLSVVSITHCEPVRELEMWLDHSFPDIRATRFFARRLLLFLNDVKGWFAQVVFYLNERDGSNERIVNLGNNSSVRRSWWFRSINRVILFISIETSIRFQLRIEQHNSRIFATLSRGN